MAILAFESQSIYLSKEKQRLVVAIGETILFINECNREIEQWQTENKGWQPIEYWQKTKEAKIIQLQRFLKEFDVNFNVS